MTPVYVVHDRQLKLVLAWAVGLGALSAVGSFVHEAWLVGVAYGVGWGIRSWFDGNRWGNNWGRGR